MFTDGPFVETKEWLAGFWVIEAADLDVALKLAAEGSQGLQSAGSRCGRSWASPDPHQAQARSRVTAPPGRRRRAG